MNQKMIDVLNPPGEARGRWAGAAWTLGVDVAGPASDAVDASARFPVEALAALREGRFLSAMLPPDLGGAGATMLDMVGAVRALAAHCASSALVLAMHCIEVVNLTRHGSTEGLVGLAHEVADHELLIANANSEVGLGGDVGRSLCALDTTTTPWTLDKRALAISYGENADLIAITARRSPDANDTDQAFVFLRASDVDLDAISEWDTLGLRGTCSRGYSVHARVDPTLVFSVPFSEVANDGGGQTGQLLRSAVWVGLAEAAATRAHAFVRAAARKEVGTVPPGAHRLSEITIAVHEARSLLAACALRYEELEAAHDLQDAGLTVALRNLKVSTSETAVRVATSALSVCGIAGYQRHSPFSLDRVIRDAHGGLIMVSNDRYRRDNAQLLLARKGL
jgi:acyl-CoA dehydrogenase